MIITFTIPDDMTLKGLEQGKRGWMAYLGPKGSLYLQGARGATPQEAVDLAAARVRKGTAEIQANKPQAYPNLKLELKL